MARNINLNSSDWCDIIFEGKNKAYGAYEMRQSSSNRHIIAFGCVVSLVVLIASIPKIMDTVTPAVSPHLINDTGIEIHMTPPPETPKEEVIIEPRLSPPPAPLARSIQFTPPVITREEIAPEQGMRTQEELQEFNGIVSTVTVETGVTEGGIDAADVLGDLGAGGGSDGGGVVDFVEQMPQYPGGTSELMHYLSSNLKYPIQAIEANIEGRVFLKFVVGKDGHISGVTILKGIDPGCDKEAMRVVEKMPKWIPGMQNGNPVAVYFTLPVVFKLTR